MTNLIWTSGPIVDLRPCWAHSTVLP